LVLTIADVDRALRVYLQALGVKLSDYSTVERQDRRAPLAFRHLNPRHHSMALVLGPAPGVKRLQHFMLETESIDDVGLGLDIMQQRGVEMVRLGRHTI
jgi:Glyoxalase/Bleomycin resistance protein/Dioxygenase superfamily